jgi:hypothetical protein
MRRTFYFGASPLRVPAVNNPTFHVGLPIFHPFRITVSMHKTIPRIVPYKLHFNLIFCGSAQSGDCAEQRYIFLFIDKKFKKTACYIELSINVFKLK